MTFVRSGSIGYVYVDGFQENSYTAAFTFSPTDRWSIGQEWDIGIPSGFLTGTVDDVRVYDRTLSPAQVQVRLSRANRTIVTFDLSC
ncbi:MAG: LamG-like jellyroll fold domain-containing protein [Planctomycetota bacterium]